MPVLETERQRMARSALRYRPVNTDQPPSAPIVSRARRQRPDAQRTAAPVAADNLEEEGDAPGHRSLIPARRRPAPRVISGRQRVHPLLFVGLGLVAMLFLWIGISQVMNWGIGEYHTLIYGNPPTFQTNAVLGQDDNNQHPSHIIAVNMRGTVTILAFPGLDPSHVRVLASTSVLGPDADQAVAILRFIDPDQTGKSDMLVAIGGIQSVLVNDGKGNFRAPTSAEQEQILAYLQQHP